MVTLISFILVIIGSINWLSVALFEFDFVAGIFGATTDPFARIIYGLVGLAAIILIYVAVKHRGIIDVSGDHDSDIARMHDDD